MTRRDFLRFALAAPIALRAGQVFAHQSPQNEDYFTGKDVFAKLMAEAKEKDWKKLPMGELVGTIGLTFVGTPYVAHTFEIFDDKEVCVINLAGLDCATFYEASLALARTIKGGRLTDSEFKKQITRIRYRDGRLKGYVSRLHYASDYFFDNDKKGTAKLITQDLPGAEVFTHPVGFMSKNPDKYRQLNANPDLVPEIAKTEAEINARKNYFLPTARVADAEQLLKTGDIVGLTTTMEGLDCSHTGMCYRDKEGVLRFLHASSAKSVMQVTLGPRLSDYLKNSKVNDGLMVVRPLEL